jgi:GH25 family lysozyme M1 (1,4-beta-N-acetylmuramidase)
MSSKIIQDNSHYQQAIDFAYLKSKGQNKMFLKVASGSLFKDTVFDEHYKNAIDNGFSIAPYVWQDPIYDAEKQGKFFLDCVKGKNIAFIVIDAEQHWKSWDEFYLMQKGKLKQYQMKNFTPDEILNHLSKLYNYIKNNSNYEIVIYTAAWFVNSYCPKMYDYLKDKYTWWADYTLFNTTKMEKTWEELEKLVPTTNIIPTLPKSYPTKRVVWFQYSGDKFLAKGVYADKNKTRLSELDLNKEINPNYTWNTIAKITETPIPDDDVEIPIEHPDDETPLPNPKDKILDVVYKSQLTGNSTRFRNDCGAAACSQLIDSFNNISTNVDDLFIRAVPNLVDRFITVYEIRNLLSKYNIPSTIKWTHDINLIKSYVDEGKPPIAVIRYKYLQESGYCDTGVVFTGNHYVTVTGYNDNQIIIHDPLYQYKDGANVHIPNEIFLKALKDPNCGMIIVPDISLNGFTPKEYETYQANVEFRYVRSLPDSSSYTTIVGERYKGDIVKIDAISNGWGHIYKTDSYIYMNNLLKVTVQEDEEEPEIFIPPYKTYRVTNSLRNIRSGAGTGYPVVGSKVKNDLVQIDETKMAEGLLWGKIYGTTNWIYMGAFFEIKD